MDLRNSVHQPTDPLKRQILLVILVLSWVGSLTAWMMMEAAGTASAVLRGVFGLNLVFHPVMFTIVGRRLWSLRAVDLACLLFASAICATCMALRLYAPILGASIDIQPLYLWIPVIYVFVFTLIGHKSSLRIALAILALFVVISLPYLIRPAQQPYANFTIQLHMVSAVLIAALHFFSSYQHRVQIAEFTVDELARLANTDALTGLPNRRRVAEAITLELLRFTRYGNPFSLILIDIDHFKTVNDRFGHGVGDKTLVALAQRTKGLLREVDTMGRWGGEEFIITQPQTTFEEALRKASILCKHIADAALVGEHVTTISCGVTSVTPGDTADTLIQRADVALYSAKHRGRNRAEGIPPQQQQVS